MPCEIPTAKVFDSARVPNQPYNIFIVALPRDAICKKGCSWNGVSCLSSEEETHAYWNTEGKWPF
eukprot:4725864-Amphidinium_carterae.1